MSEFSLPPEGHEGKLEVVHRVIKHSADLTIRSPLEAIVELVTNSDDSYKRLEAKGIKVKGDIHIRIRRKKNGKCEFIQVIDHAEGMDSSTLYRALRFGGATSGLLEGQSVRGFFGRGLKEAIIGLGKGTIATYKDGKESAVEIWWEKGEAKFKVLTRERPTNMPNGTSVFIEVHKEVSLPTFKTLRRMIENHYSLRKICENPHRKVKFTMEGFGALKARSGEGGRTEFLSFIPPSSVLKKAGKFTLSKAGEITIKIYESKEKLNFSPSDPSSLAGIVITTEGIPLDLQLFGFDSDETAYYFWGELDWPLLGELLRQDDPSLLNPHRCGINWRHQICQEVYQAVHTILKKLVEAKSKELEAKEEISPAHQQKIHKICRMLNKLARKELSISEEGDSLKEEEEASIESLTIRPEIGYGRPSVPRQFTVYLPKEICKGKNPPIVKIEVDSQDNVIVKPKSVTLYTHPKYVSLLYGSFEVTGFHEGDEAYVYAKWKNLEDMAHFLVKKSESSRKRGKLSGIRKGLFKNITRDYTPNPQQRVGLVDGEIKIYMNFPCIKNYLGPKLEKIEEPRGSVLFAELICEAFCKFIARRRLDLGLEPSGPSPIDAFNSVYNRLLRNYYSVIHRTVVSG
ncbi:ATP-binding protein [Candidatus Calescamantes bacterium]|nr:ATP-binding protein [Candidatus Calescamantes bacterium]